MVPSTPTLAVRTARVLRGNEAHTNARHLDRDPIHATRDHHFPRSRRGPALAAVSKSVVLELTLMRARSVRMEAMNDGQPKNGEDS